MKIKPVWNKLRSRWEIADPESKKMRALRFYDLQDMADDYVGGKGFPPEINEEFVYEKLRKYQKKYKIQEPLPKWAINFLKEYEEASGVCRPSVESVEDMLRKHADIP